MVKTQGNNSPDNESYGTWVTRRGRFLSCAIRRPFDFARWLRDRIRNKTALDQAVPLLSWAAYDFLRRNLREGMRVFEWGGGGSTLFFLKCGCSVTTVEDSVEWKNAIERRASNLFAEQRHNLVVHLVPLQNGDERSISRYREPVRSGQWDVVLVDGAHSICRVKCVETAKDNVLPGGWLVLDDSYRPNYAPVAEMLRDWQRLEFWGLGPGRRGVTKTDVYVRPDRH